MAAKIVHQRKLRIRPLHREKLSQPFNTVLYDLDSERDPRFLVVMEVPTAQLGQVPFTSLSGELTEELFGLYGPKCQVIVTTDQSMVEVFEIEPHKLKVERDHDVAQGKTHGRAFGQCTIKNIDIDYLKGYIAALEAKMDGTENNFMLGYYSALQDVVYHLERLEHEKG